VRSRKSTWVPEAPSGVEKRRRPKLIFRYNINDRLLSH